MSYNDHTHQWIHDAVKRATMRMELDTIKEHVEQWAHDLREKGLDAEEVYVMIDQTIDDAVESGQWQGVHRALAGLYLDRWYDNEQ